MKRLTFRRRLTLPPVFAKLVRVLAIVFLAAGAAGGVLAALSAGPQTGPWQTAFRAFETATLIGVLPGGALLTLSRPPIHLAVIVFAATVIGATGIVPLSALTAVAAYAVFVLVKNLKPDRETEEPPHTGPGDLNDNTISEEDGDGPASRPEAESGDGIGGALEAPMPPTADPRFLAVAATSMILGAYWLSADVERHWLWELMTGLGLCLLVPLLCLLRAAGIDVRRRVPLLAEVADNVVAAVRTERMRQHAAARDRRGAGGRRSIRNERETQ